MRAEDLFAQTIAGKYRIEEFLGAGAMGTVYRGRHLELDKTVAVKVMNRSLERDPSLVERFHREARAASLFDHPNSIRVLDFGREPNGRLYLVMEYVAGRDLCRLIAEEGVLPATRIVDILTQVLAALAVAHEMGVLHRDLKPENILILHTTGDDERELDIVKVCDFGIAKITVPLATERAFGRRRPITAGFIVGTPEYMAPEQVLAAKVDARCDIYAMGVILYQLLAGTLPFDGDDSIVVAMKRIAEDPPLPSTRRPDVDPRLEAICMKAMSRLPAARFQTAREMRTALQAARDSVELLGPPLQRNVPSFDHAPAKPETCRPIPEPQTRSHRWKAVAFPAFVLLAGSLVAWARAGVPIAPSSPPAAVSEVSPPIEPIALVAFAPQPNAPTPVTPLATAPARPADAIARARKTVQTVITSAPVAEPTPPVPESRAAEPVLGALPLAPAPPPPQLSPPPLTRSPAPRPPAQDFRTAHVNVAGTGQVIGTTVANVRKVLAPLEPKLTACYRDALASARATAVEGLAPLHLETDGDGIIVEARVDGPFAGLLGDCAFRIIRGKRIPNVDTGRASVDTTIAVHSR